MRDEFKELLRLRFDERNHQMIKSFTQMKQRFNNRGLLNSSNTIAAIHEVLKSELVESNEAIVTTAFDIIKRENLIPRTVQIKRVCSDALAKRKEEIERLFSSNVQHIEVGLQNKTMIEPYRSLDDFYALQHEEMLIKVSALHQQYINEHGGNLANVLKNRFLNRRLISCGVITIAVIIAIAAFWDAIVDLLNFIKGKS